MVDTKVSQKLGFVEKVGFGLGDTASNFVFQMVIMFMAYFYTDVFGISAAAMGTLFLLVRIIDAVTDPIMGALADRTETRWGKFRPYLLWLALPYGIIAVLAFTTPEYSASGKLIYAYITYTLLMVIYTAINIPYSALGGVITADTDERVSISSYRFFLASIAGVVIAFTTKSLVNYLGMGSEQKGFQYTMMIFAAMAVIMFWASFALTRERVVPTKQGSSSFWTDLKFLVKNDQFLVVAALNFVLLIPIIIRGGSAMYYLKWVMLREDLTSWFLGIGMLSAMIGASFATPLTKKLPKVKAYILIQSVITIGSVLLYFIPTNSIGMIFVIFAVLQFFTMMGAPILWAMMADTVDYGEFRTQRRTTGLVFSGALFSLKLGMALGGALLGWLLAGFGYSGDATIQSERTIHGIILLFTVFPAIGHFILIFIVPKYNLTKEKCESIRAELDARASSSLGQSQ